MRATREVWDEGYEFGRAEATWEYAQSRVAGAPITTTKATKDTGDEAFWAYHLRRVEEGHYE